MSSERWWLMGAFVVTLAGASIPTWTKVGPPLEGTASAATRHRPRAQRGEATDPLLASAPEPPSPLPSPPLARRPHAHEPEPEEERVTIDVPDLPEPVRGGPLSWDDLFPAPPPRKNGAPAPATAPCFDQLQGIEGLSPCPAVTPR
jgi:hypothetical protein